MILNYKSDAVEANGQTVRAMTHTFFREHFIAGYFGKTDVMAKFTPSFAGVKGRALFSLLFMAPLVHAAAKDGETLTVTADPYASTDATSGYQPLNTSTATLTNMPMLDIPQVVNTVSDKVLEDQNATTLDEALYNVSNVVQTNTPAARRMPSCAVASAQTAMARS